MTRKITVEVDDTVYGLLEVLTKPTDAPASVEDVVRQLIDHAQQGVYRPGAWEREWLIQAFGYQWQSFLQPGDPYGRDDLVSKALFQRPVR
jgi:hypothetical protein